MIKKIIFIFYMKKQNPLHKIFQMLKDYKSVNLKTIEFEAIG